MVDNELTRYLLYDTVDGNISIIKTTESQHQTKIQSWRRKEEGKL
jgi:hypothetical protein